MLTLSLDIYLTRLLRAKCAQCRKRRVLYEVVLYPVGVIGFGAIGIRSVARCAKCLGIGK